MDVSNFIAKYFTSDSCNEEYDGFAQYEPKPGIIVELKEIGQPIDNIQVMDSHVMIHYNDGEDFVRCDDVMETIDVTVYKRVDK